MSNAPILNLFRIPDLRRKVMITLVLLMVYRIGFHIPLPGVNLEKVRELQSEAFGGGPLGSLFGVMNMLTGAAINNAVLFSLGVMPYISASIIFSLLVKVVPSLEALSKEGPAGQRKINQYTRLTTVPICIVQSIFIIQGVLLNSQLQFVSEVTLGGYLMYIVALTAGTVFIMWIGEQITEHGIGNGVSLIIMGGIIAQLPGAIAQHVANSYGDEAISNLIYMAAMWVGIVLVIVFITRGQRRIPIQQAKLTRGRRQVGGQKHYLPLKINQAGVMPIIFASALLIVPQMLGQIPAMRGLSDVFRRGTGFWYITFYGSMIFFFSFFWNSLMFQPSEIAKNLKEHGSFIPGIRPGKRTSEFLEKIMVRITLAGAAFLTVIAIIPNLITSTLNVSQMVTAFLGGTSVLIVVGVALDLVDRINAHLVMRQYEGLMSKGGTGAGWTKRKK
ncbi:MAG: preprotein translocase subunit SecY [Planctomycetes bacterium]|nr:preprotein translocase subunit SecY [Planctomycetota bacterium]